MALASAKAAPLRPDIKLSQALSGYEAVLSAEQRQSYKASPPDAVAVMALTCEVDRQNSNRKTRRCGARLTSFLNSVKGFTGIVDLIIGSVGNPIASAVWGSVKTAIQIASGFESYFDSLSKMLMNVGLSSPRFEKYALLYPTSTSLRKGLCNYYAVVVNLCTRIVLFVGKPVIKQIASVLRKPFEDEFGTLQKDLIQLGATVNEEVALASRQQQNLDSVEAANERKENSLFRAAGSVFRKETANELEKAKKWRASKAKSRFLNSCSSYNHETSLNQARKKGSSTWIFETEEYQRWTSSYFPSTLLCSGIMGAGKTVLSANVIEHLTVNNTSGFCMAYFFCRDDDAITMLAREIIGSLARQMFADIPADSFTQLEPNIGNMSLNTEQIVSQMLRLLRRRKHYVVILDGLDECDYEEIKVLVESLRSLLMSTEHIFRCFCTARSDFAVRLSDQFRPEFQIRISHSNNGPEISRFIEAALEDALENCRLKLRDPQIIFMIQDALEAGAQEMFLWVAFQVNSLCAQNSDHDILNCLQDLPKGLPATFRRILRRLQQSEFANPRLSKKIFQIIAAAQRPLTLNELAEAISITPGDTSWNNSKLVNDIMKSLEACGSFVTIDEEHSTVHFAHSSVKRHLLSQPTTLDVHEYHIELPPAKRHFGKIVVTVLNLDVLGTQLTRTSGSSQQYSGMIPTGVAISALPKHDVINKVALAMLRSRRTPRTNPGPILDDGFLREGNTQIPEVFSFLPYCQEYFLHHTQDMDPADDIIIYKLWERVIDGTMRTVDLPWTAGEPINLDQRFMDWLTKSHHPALIERTIFRLCETGQPQYHMGELENPLVIWRTCGRSGSRPLPVLQVSNVILCNAASSGHQAIVQRALEEGVNVNSKSRKLGNALHAAISQGHEPIARLLIQSGADVNLKGGDYGSALQAAAARIHMDSIARLLLAKGADPNAQGGKYGTALIAAAAVENVAVIMMLLKAGANIDRSCDNRGHIVTPLITAIKNGTGEVFVVLLEAGANPNARGSGIYSPLQVAAKRGNDYMVKRLIDEGARVSFNHKLSGSIQEIVEEMETTRSIAVMIQENERRMHV